MIEPGQMYRGDLSGDQITAMLKFAAVPPVANAQDIHDFELVTCGFKPDSVYFVRQEGHVLPCDLWPTAFAGVLWSQVHPRDDHCSRTNALSS